MDAIAKKAQAAPKFIRLATVLQMTGLSRSSIYRLEAAGRFPRRAQLGVRAVAWRPEDVDSWVKSRKPPEGRSHG